MGTGGRVLLSGHRLHMTVVRTSTRAQKELVLPTIRSMPCSIFVLDIMKARLSARLMIGLPRRQQTYSTLRRDIFCATIRIGHLLTIPATCSTDYIRPLAAAYHQGKKSTPSIKTRPAKNRWFLFSMRARSCSASTPELIIKPWCKLLYSLRICQPLFSCSSSSGLARNVVRTC